jgi:regulatory protein
MPTNSAWRDLMRLLRYRPRTIAESRRRLSQRGHPAQRVDRTIEQAKAAGLLDDRAFTQLWIEDRLMHKPLSRRAIRLELEDLGVDPTLIREHLGKLYPAEREPLLAMKLAEERLRRSASTDPETNKERTAAFLVRRGFSRGVAVRAVRAASDRMEEEDRE